MQMNEQLPSAPDYQAAIYQTLLRIERLLKRVRWIIAPLCPNLSRQCP